MLRGFAAMAVVISHYFDVFWIKRATVAALTNTPILPLANYAVPKYITWLNPIPLFNWGAYGVALFFLISGFVIPFSLKRTSWLGFSINRLTRILPTYAVGFSLTLLAIGLGGTYFGKPWPFTLNEILIHYIPGIRDLLRTKNIDGIIWTLEIEMKFYFVCMLAIIWFRHESKKVFLIPIALFTISMFYTQALTLTFVSQYIIFMFIGVVFHYLHNGKLAPEKSMLAIFGLFFIFCALWQSTVYKDSFYLAWNYALALLTFAIAFVYPNIFRANRLFNFFADISYPLYVIHGVAGYVVLRILLDLGIKGWQSLLIVTITAILLALTMHKLIEEPSQKFGKWISTRFKY